jgi:hypothetical protein
MGDGRTAASTWKRVILKERPIHPFDEGRVHKIGQGTTGRVTQS